MPAGSNARSTPSLAPVEAAIFDTDGVIARTAEVHERSWASVFDEVLEQHGQGSSPFTHQDYLQHVDGRPRYDGVATFLGSRGIELPRGDPQDAPDVATVCGVGNRKNERFLVEIERGGVRAFESTLEFVRTLRRVGTRVAVISASRNCAQVLAGAGAAELFEARVDGVVAAELGLAGKPDPAVFVEAARRLGVAPARAAIVEDSLAGVRAGHDGGFGLVVGIDRDSDGSALLEAGAHVAVDDLARLRVDDRGGWTVTEGG